MLEKKISDLSTRVVALREIRKQLDDCLSKNKKFKVDFNIKISPLDDDSVKKAENILNKNAVLHEEVLLALVERIETQYKEATRAYKSYLEKYQDFIEGEY